MPIADDATMITAAGTGSGATPWQSLAGLLGRSLVPAPSPQEPAALAAKGGPGEEDGDEPDRDEALLLALTSLPIY